MMSDTRWPESSRINVVGLAKSYGVRQVIEGLDLVIGCGEIVALVGRSGCGKSTLLRLIAGLEQPDAGRVELAREQEKLRVLFQEPRLLPWKTVLGNVGLGQRGAWEADARAMLAAVGLEGREDEWPLALSGGQRQRVSLARALLSRPSILLLDEPFSALDALTRLEMHRLFECIWMQNRFSALLVTHDVPESVALADRVIILESGRVAETFHVDLDRPRDRRQPGLAQLESLILRRLLPDG